MPVSPEDEVAKRQRDDSDLRRWAVVGAEQRLLQIAEEAATIFHVFPELRERGFMAKGGRGGHLPGPFAEGGGKRTRRRRRTMSPEARKRISEAQKARWAKQKAGGKKR
jgi:hypothetical protein